MRAYTLLTIKTCHKRNAHAIGGMAAQIPIKNDLAANQEAMNKVRVDKEREATDGHDGTWVAHPGLVPVALEAFNAIMEGPNQLDKKREEDPQVSATDLLAVPQGSITEQGLRMNISVGIQYIEAWLRGSGAVPIFNLMEDAATAEISRTQVWQWIRHSKGFLSDGRKVTFEMVSQFQQEELDKIRETVGAQNFESGQYALASKLFTRFVEEDDFTEFLTIPGYDYLN